MSKNIKKILALLLAAMMLVTFCACDTEKDGEGSSVNGGSDGADNNEEKEKIDIDDIELKENEGVSEDGVVFDKTLKLNGYSFQLKCDIDEFLNGTGAILENPDDLEYFKNDQDAILQGLDCYIQDGDNKVKFHVTVKHNDEGGTELREISFMTDIRYKDDDFLENPNLITCGFEFLGGCDIDKNHFLDLPEDIVELAEVSEESYGTEYELDLKTAKGDYWSIRVMASNSDENPNRYFFDSVVVSSVVPF